MTLRQRMLALSVQKTYFTQSLKSDIQIWLNFVCQCVGKKLTACYSLKSSKNQNRYLGCHKYSENSNKKCSKIAIQTMKSH